MTAAPDAADAPAPQSDPAPAEPTGASTHPAGTPDEWSRPDAPTPDPATPAGPPNDRSRPDAAMPDPVTPAGPPNAHSPDPAAPADPPDAHSPDPAAPASPPDSTNIADRLFGAAPMLATSEGNTGTPDPAPAAPAQKRVRPLTIVIVVLAAAAIAAGITVGPTAVRIAQQRNATLAMPEAVAELKRDDSEGAKEAASDLVTALRAEIELDQSAAAVYSDPTNDPGKSIMLFGGTTLLLSPERELDAVLKLTEDAGDRIHGLQSVDPGPLGGIMKCGSTGTETSPMAVCGWADHGSIALALFPERSPADAAFLMRTLRWATLTR